MTDSKSKKNKKCHIKSVKVDSSAISNKRQIESDNIVVFTNKETYYYQMINKYFRSIDKQYIAYMLSIIKGDSKISLRLLDWFVTRYTRKYKTSYYNDKTGERINVHINYKAQLKSYKKRYFDPFRRRKKFYYTYNKKKKKKMHTTLGQLNFFRWAIRSGVIKYVEDNYDVISNAMILSNKADKLRKHKKNSETSSELGSEKSSDSKVEIKKYGITIKAKKKIKNNEATIILSFD